MTSFTLWLRSTLVGIAIMLPVAKSDASPWTLPKDRLVMSATTGYSYADHEFLNDGQGTRQAFPLQGNLEIYSLRVSGRYGLQDDLELEVSTAFMSLMYSAESFVKQPTGELIHLDNSDTGIGDVKLMLTKQLLSESWPLSLQVAFKLPTGYDLPEPNRVALGSGQSDLSGILQLGHLFSSGTLIGLDGGMVYRLKGPGHQVKYGAKLAQRLVDRFFLFVAQTGYHSITEGETTGRFNRVSRSPATSAQDFNLDDTYELPFALTQDLHQAEVGFFLGTQSRVEYSGALVVPWAGKNTSQLISMFLTVSHPL